MRPDLMLRAMDIARVRFVSAQMHYVATGISYEDLVDIVYDELINGRCVAGSCGD